MKENCNFFLKRNGKVLYTPNIKNDLYCFTKGYRNLYTLEFNNFNGINEEYIIDKLLLFEKLKKYNLKYLQINKNTICLYNTNVKNIENNIIFKLFIDKITNDSEKYKKYFYGSLLKRLTTYFMFLKLILKNISDQNILTILFYNTYIDEVDVTNYLKKTDFDKNSFSNFHQLYMFLKKAGLVDKYYNYYGPKMIKGYLTMYNKFSKSKQFKAFKDKKLKKVKLFNDIDLLNIVEKNVNKKFNKEFIKNKFIELTKKYNV